MTRTSQQPSLYGRIYAQQYYTMYMHMYLKRSEWCDEILLKKTLLAKYSCHHNFHNNEYKPEFN